MAPKITLFGHELFSNRPFRLDRWFNSKVPPPFIIINVLKNVSLKEIVIVGRAEQSRYSKLENNRSILSQWMISPFRKWNHVSHFYWWIIMKRTCQRGCSAIRVYWRRVEWSLFTHFVLCSDVLFNNGRVQRKWASEAFGRVIVAHYPPVGCFVYSPAAQASKQFR
jgi:hypothetical protein